MFNLNIAKAFSTLIVLVLACIPIAVISCNQQATSQQTNNQTQEIPILIQTPPAQTMVVSSWSFYAGSEIPVYYTCNGNNVSPELSWSAGPQGTKSYVLLVNDPDASSYAHWVLYNIPVYVTDLSENISAQSLLEMHAVQGINDGGTTGYTGPCPPPGKVHHYVFSMYAIDTSLSFSSAHFDEVLNAIQGHILAEGEITGTYESK